MFLSSRRPPSNGSQRLLAFPALISLCAVQISNSCREHDQRGRTLSLLVTLLLIGMILGAPRIVRGAESVPSQTLRNVAGIVAHRGGKSVPIGTGFFVAVPSRVYVGRSFIYLVTAHHNLLDPDGKPAEGLFLTLEDSKTGAMREEVLPPETKWILNPRNESVDVAATPLNPANANIAPISLDSIMSSDMEMNMLAETGAQVYYLTAASVGIAKPQFEALARFGRVSVARPAEAEVPIAGVQRLCFMDGGATPDFSSGAPVFVQAGLRFVLWGILESNNSASATSTFQGLAGVLPASNVAETVKAMAAAQEKGASK